MGKFFKFEKMLTPVIIQLVFWLGFLGSIISGFVMVGYGMLSGSGTVMQAVTGVLVLLIGPVVIRIYCEMLIIVFKMYKALLSIRDSLQIYGDVSRVPEGEREIM